MIRLVPELSGPRGATPDRSDLHWWITLGAVCLFALALRAIYLAQVAALPFFDQPVGDSAAHLARAADIARGHWLPARPFYYCSIYYPYLLAGLLHFAHSVRGVCLAVCRLQMIAGAALVACVGLAARQLFDPRAGIAAALIATLYGPSAFFEADILGVAWGQLALVLAILACLAWARGFRPGKLALAGVAFGLAAIERPNLLTVVPLVALWALVLSRGHRAISSLLALAAGVAIPLVIVLTLNVAGTGQWVPLTTSAGINLALGYHSGGDGTYDEPWERESSQFSARHTEPEEAMTEWASREVGHALTPLQASRYWQQKTLEYISQHPREAGFVTLRKAALMLNAGEVPNHLDFTFLRERAPALWLMPVGFGLILVLAVVGLGSTLRTRDRRWGAWLLISVAAGAMLGVLPFTVADRYRAPMVPPLLIAAGGGLMYLVGAMKRGERRMRLSPAVATAALIAMLVTLVPLFRPVRSRDYWMFAQAYDAHGDLPRAIDAYQRAVAAGGDRGEVLNNLASAYARSGDRDRAVTTLRQAISADPRLALPHKNLGMLLIGRGERDSALAHLSLAHALEPDDHEVLGAIGALLFERGSTQAARDTFARALALAPGDARLRALVAHYLPGVTLVRSK